MKWSCIGHEEQKEYLARLVADGTLAHAYLLAGPDGVGKRMIAEDVARALVPAGYAGDVMRLAPATDEDGKVHDIPIEAVKELKKWLSLRPVGAHKVVVIDDAERLGDEAANTLLKALEEPPAYAHFLLVSGKSGQVMATIASRCERVDFRLLSDDHMKQVLSSYTPDADDTALLAAVAAGKPGHAIRLLQGNRLQAVATAIADLEQVLKAGTAEKLIYAKKLADHEAASDIVSWWLAWTHSRLAARPQLAGVAAGLLDLAAVLAEPQFNRRLALEHFLLTNSSQK